MADPSTSSAPPPQAPKRTLDECHKILTGPGMPWEMENRVIKGRKVRVYKQLPPSVRDFWLATKAHGKKECIVYENERYSYEEAQTKVQHLASLFHQRGVRKGDRIAIAMRNLPEWIFTFFAAHSIGAVAVAVNAWLSPEALAHVLNLTQPSLAVVDEERATLFKRQLGSLSEGGCKSLIVVRARGQTPAGFERFEDALRSTPARPLPPIEILPEDPAILFLTSGTTSLPKAVLSTQRQFLTNRLNTSIASARSLLRQGLSLPAPDPNAEQRVALITIPLFHVMGCHSFLMLATAIGAKMILMHKFDAVKAAEIVEKEGVHTVGGVPHLVMQMYEQLDPNKSTKLDGFSFGGGPAAARLPGDVKRKLKNVSPAQGYGLTEVNSVATSVAGEDYVQHPLSCGLAAPTVDLKIIPVDSPDPVSKSPSLETGQVGEVCIFGCNVAEGYYNDEKSTQAAFEEDGWFRSGDVGYLDADGFLFITDRSKDMIIRSGENIASVSVENAIFQHDAVKEVAVVGMPDDLRGEEVVALCVPHESASSSPPTEEILQKLVISLLPKHCVPAMILFSQTELPRNATGKILKAQVKKHCASEWERRQAKKTKAKL
ncbi:class I adenylate-forming enzyme family protein [Sporobolomyces salmoneus]|uniref:class I adenylate-forming enzyme family protein n=1 Tax=Sporobolomyces salmoneus TaxID=183962 RepID=UPI003174E196